MCVRACVCVYVCMYVRTYVCAYVFMYLCVCAHVRMYVLFLYFANELEECENEKQSVEGQENCHLIL